MDKMMTEKRSSTHVARRSAGDPKDQECIAADSPSGAKPLLVRPWDLPLWHPTDAAGGSTSWHLDVMADKS